MSEYVSVLHEQVNERNLVKEADEERAELGEKETGTGKNRSTNDRRGRRKKIEDAVEEESTCLNDMTLKDTEKTMEEVLKEMDQVQFELHSARADLLVFQVYLHLFGWFVCLYVFSSVNA